MQMYWIKCRGWGAGGKQREKYIIPNNIKTINIMKNKTDWEKLFAMQATVDCLKISIQNM